MAKGVDNFSTTLGLSVPHWQAKSLLSIKRMVSLVIRPLIHVSIDRLMTIVSIIEIFFSVAVFCSVLS